MKSFEYRLNERGDVNDEIYSGLFKIKAFLSPRDVLKIDEFRRSYLGQGAENASQDALATAQALAELNVRILESPQFWVDNQRGLDLEDQNIIATLWRAVQTHDQERTQAILARKAEADKALKEQQSDKPKE